MKIALFTLFCAAAVSLLWACNGSKNMPNSNTKLIELNQGGCRGYCPIFRLTFKNNGTAEYEGTRFVEQTGIKAFSITETELAELKRLTTAANVWQYPERIDSKIADAPWGTLVVFDGEKQKSVAGTVDRPKALLTLENYMKDLAEKHGIHVRRGVDPNSVNTATKSEVIVQLKEGVNAGNWIAKFTEFKFNLVKRVPPNNTWLVAYDREQIQEAAVIELFKGSEGVINVQANAKADDRN